MFPYAYLSTSFNPIYHYKKNSQKTPPEIKINRKTMKKQLTRVGGAKPISMKTDTNLILISEICKFLIKKFKIICMLKIFIIFVSNIVAYDN